MDGGAWKAAVHGVAKSRTRLSEFTLTFHFHAQEKEVATHSSTLAWKIPWTEEPGRLQSMGSLRVGRDWVTSLSLFTFMHWRRKWQPTPVFLPGESQGRWSLLGCRSMGSHRVGHNWSNLAAAAGLLKLCWIRVARLDILVLFLILGEMLSVFHHWEWCLLWVYCIWSLANTVPS